MMPRKLFQRMTDEQEAMAKAFLEGNQDAYEKAEAEQEKLMGAWYNKMDADQRTEWSAVCARLDAFVVGELEKRERNLTSFAPDSASRFASEPVFMLYELGSKEPQ